MKEYLDLIRGCVRPWIAYVFSGVFVGLAIYGFVKFADADLAKTIIVGFIGIVGTVIGFYFGERKASK